MKKFLITIFPFCAILFILIWIPCGLKGMFAFFGVVIFAVVLVSGVTKWIDFVDKHIKD